MINYIDSLTKGEGKMTNEYKETLELLKADFEAEYAMLVSEGDSPEWCQDLVAIIHDIEMELKNA